MQKYNIQIQYAFAPFLISHIEASSTATVTRCPRVIDNLELTADQLHCIVHCTSVQELQRGLVHDYLGLAGGLRRSFLGGVFCLEDGVFFRVDLRCGFQGHHILEPVASSAGNCDTEMVVWVLFKDRWR